MKEKLIVACGHQKNVGKDKFVTFCIDVLRSETRKLRIVRRGFADKVYELCFSLYGWAGFKPKAYYDEHPNAKNDVIINGKTVRQLLIDLGMLIRSYDGDAWLNACLKGDDFDILFITDLRFPNEFEAVQELGGFLVRIMRPELPEPTDIADCALNDYKDQWPITIVNNESLHKLHKEAEKFIFDRILERK